MGVTSKSIEVINRVLQNWAPAVSSVCDLGSQNDYQEHIVASNPSKYPYISEWWKAKGISYVCIDLCGENNAKVWDLTKPLPESLPPFDVVMDFGTSEHVSREGYYQCHLNIHNLTRVGGIIIHENPKTGNWPGHGNNYVTVEWYQKFAERCGYSLLHTEEHPAMGNSTDGWNVIAVLRKNNDYFIGPEAFEPSFSK